MIAKIGKRCMNLIARVRDAFTEHGIYNGILFISEEALERFDGFIKLSKDLIVAQPIPDQKLIHGRLGKSIDVRLIDAGDDVLDGLMRSQEVLEWRFRQGAICFGAFQNGALIGHLWLSLGPYEEDDINCGFSSEDPERFSWDFDVEILPENRTGLVFARLWDEANAYCRERGVRWTYSRISAFNTKSLEPHKRLGARAIGRLFVVKIGRIQIARSSIRPRFQVSWSQSNKPHYILSAEA